MDMSLRHFRRQFEQLSQFERGKIIGMMEAGWSARRVARQLGSSDCVAEEVLGPVDQRMSFISKTRLRTPSIDQSSIRSPYPCVFSPLTIPSTWLKGHLGLRHKLRVLPADAHPSTSTFGWCRASEAGFCSELEQVVFRDEPRFKFSSDDNRIRVRRPRGERLNPAFALQRHRPHSWCDGMGVPLPTTHGNLVFEPWHHDSPAVTARDIPQNHVCYLSSNGSVQDIFNKTMLLTRQGCKMTCLSACCYFLGLLILMLSPIEHI
ncbi:transposable element Tcb1 transposase [Trichonephila clavipes]|nr:transposable element Tcb1 transposase [Trichonephila clavipes]